MSPAAPALQVDSLLLSCRGSPRKSLGMIQTNIRAKETQPSIQFSHSVVSNSLQSHGLQHTRFPCPSPFLWVYSNSCPLSQWCHPTISSSVVPFSSHIQSFPATGSFAVSQFFTSSGQSIRVSASVSILRLISFRMDWLDLLAVQETLKSLLSEKWVAELWSLVSFTEWRDCWNFLVRLLRSILCCYSVQNTLLSASWLHPL